MLTYFVEVQVIVFQDQSPGVVWRSEHKAEYGQHTLLQERYEGQLTTTMLHKAYTRYRDRPLEGRGYTVRHVIKKHGGVRQYRHWSLRIR